uniref:Uncharacterized protein n=1 Tax=Spongospora subterranea TaxID=70186 RepID=A0A0H5R754_9EUKA|eukprot:CRZ04124.1 hypothetical protein [Spongospora subterranea]
MGALSLKDNFVKLMTEGTHFLQCGPIWYVFFCSCIWPLTTYTNDHFLDVQIVLMPWLFNIWCYYSKKCEFSTIAFANQTLHLLAANIPSVVDSADFKICRS